MTEGYNWVHLRSLYCVNKCHNRIQLGASRPVRYTFPYIYINISRKQHEQQSNTTVLAVTACMVAVTGLFVNALQYRWNLLRHFISSSCKIIRTTIIIPTRPRTGTLGHRLCHYKQFQCSYVPLRYYLYDSAVDIS